jgi:hypothetical protein
MASFSCDLCDVVKATAEDLDNHILKKHRTAKRIRYACDFPECATSFENYQSLKRHRRARHQDMSAIDDETVASIQMIPADEDPVVQPDQLKSLIGHFLLKIRTEDKLSDKASERLATNLEHFTKDFSNIIKKNLTDRLENSGEGHAAALISSPQYSDVFSSKEFFDPFRTIYRQNKFIRENFHLIEPVEIKLGQRIAKRKIGGVYPMKIIDCVAYVVPVLESLGALLKMPQVANDVLNRPVNVSDYMSDIFEGSYCRNDPVFVDPSALKILSFDDEFVSVNAMGPSAKKHKFLAFYFTLCNIRPEFRSRLPAIQLFAIARSIDVKCCPCAVDTLLADFVAGMNALRQGVRFEVGGSSRLLRGGLVAHAADTLASQSIGGFLEGVGTAISPCRTCDIRKADLKSMFVSDPQLRRSAEEHRERLRALESGNQEFVEQWKRTWGIKNRSPLLRIDGVDITKLLIHDPMHVLLEGIDHLVLKHSLRYFITRNYLSLEAINSAIENFEYQNEQLRDKPSRIEQSALNAKQNNLRQTAAGMMNLILLFPFMWGHHVPKADQVWRNLVLLRKIHILSLSPICNNDTKINLKYVIAEHHYNFFRLFPTASMTPKMHYLLHFPEQLELHGPLRMHWTMRFESKHSEFKSMNIENYKNAIKTMAEKHQRSMCSDMIDQFGNPNPAFLYDGDIVGAGSSELLMNSVFFPEFPIDSEEEKIFLADFVRINGHRYEGGTVLVLELYCDGAVIPKFGQIVSIGVHENIKVFRLNILRIDEYCEHFGAFEISPTDCFQTIKYSDLLFKWPQLSNKFDGKTYITLFAVPSIA